LVVLKQSAGQFLCITKNAAVAVTQEGKILTAYSRAFFDEAILGILKAGGF